MSAFAGQTIDLDIFAGTDDTLNGNLFIDDVSLTDSAVVPLEADGESPIVGIVEAAVKLSTPGPAQLHAEKSDRGNRFLRLLHEYRESSFQKAGN